MIARLVAIATGAGLVFAGPPAFSSPMSLGRDSRHVERLAGCFSVTYRFVEDGVHDSLGNEYGLTEPITEWIELTRQDDRGLTLLHVSITEDRRAVPHFHEVWTYHPDDESWTQEIWSRTPVDENRELRYRCTAPWELNRWECHAGKARKPFRDAGAPFGFDRTDYEWLDRKNIVLVTQNGWVHNQHNKKLTEDDELVSYELGWITYRRVDEAQCDAAIERSAVEEAAE